MFENGKLYPLLSLCLIENGQKKQIFLETVASSSKTLVISFLNAHALVMAGKNAVFARHLLEADYLLRDGVGVSVLLKLLGRASGLNMNGTDLTPEIIRAFAGRRVALCGTREPWLSKAAEVVEGMGVTVALRMDGFQPIEAYAEGLVGAEVDLVILAMGMPRQEEVAAYLKAHVSRPMVIVNAGAILDFMANRFPRAPKVLRQMRLEWLYRLLQEPRRLAGRYIGGGFAFAGIALRLWAAQKFGKEEA